MSVANLLLRIPKDDVLGVAVGVEDGVVVETGVGLLDDGALLL